MATEAKKYTLKPTGDHVVVKLDDPESVSKGGIVLPSNAQEKPSMGMVLAVGPGALLKTGGRAEMFVSVGDRVLLNKYSGTEIEINDQDLMIVREQDILSVVE